jgi:hypothetical protein
MGSEDRQDKLFTNLLEFTSKIVIKDFEVTQVIFNRLKYRKGCVKEMYSF